jgi:hypothetical protein
MVAIVGFEPRTRDLALQDGELITQHEDLGILGTIASTAQHQQLDDEAGKTLEAATRRSSQRPNRSAQRNAKPLLNTYGPIFGTHTFCRSGEPGGSLGGYEDTRR